MVDSVVVSMADAPKTPEEQAAHDLAMQKVADEKATALSATDKRPNAPDGSNVSLDQKTTTDDGIAKRPDDVPEKFWNAEKGVINTEALLKSQKDGEAALRANQQKTPEQIAADAAAAKTAADADGTTTPDQSTAVTAASKEFAEKGELTSETYDALAKSGLDRGMVDEYILGQQAIVSGLEGAAFGPFEGSKDDYNKAADWAAANMSDDEITALDIQLQSKNPAIVKQGAIALQAKYAANADVDPNVTIIGDGAANITGSIFRSAAEMKTAMRDPKYKTDSAFRADVAGKIDRAGKAGVDLFV